MKMQRCIHLLTTRIAISRSSRIPTLKLANDENTTVTFRLTKKELGEVPASVNVSIGGLNETLILKEKAPPPTTTPGSGGTAAGGEEAVPGFTAVSVIAALCFVVIYRRLSRKGR
jgi:hypothetical protein